MKNKQIKEIFNLDKKEVKKFNKNLYQLLENLDYEVAKELTLKRNKEQYIKVLENEKYFTSLLDFEEELYPMLLSRNYFLWKRYAEDISLSKQARMRSAYLYSYLTRKPLKLKFDVNDFKKKPSFYHGNKIPDGDGIAKMYGLKNGLDNLRFNQYKNTGSW